MEGQWESGDAGRIQCEWEQSTKKGTMNKKREGDVTVRCPSLGAQWCLDLRGHRRSAVTLCVRVSQIVICCGQKHCSYSAHHQQRVHSTL